MELITCCFSDREGRAPCTCSAYRPEMAHRVTYVSAHVAQDIFHFVSIRLDIVEWISNRVPCRHVCTQLCNVPPMIGAPIYFWDVSGVFLWK